MNSRQPVLSPLTSAAILFASLTCAFCAAEIVEIPLENPSFEDGLEANGAPIGWRFYMSPDETRRIELVDAAHEGESAVLIYDDNPGEEIGITQSVPLEPGLTYQISVMVRGVEGASSGGSYLQFRFQPSDEFVQKGLSAPSTTRYREVSLKATAPPDTKSVTIYLYTHRGPTPKVMVDSVKLVSGVEPPPPPPPPCLPPPQYDKLKDLHLTTDLVRDGKATITIVTPASGVYDELATRIQAAIQAITGVEVEIATDGSPAGFVPTPRDAPKRKDVDVSADERPQAPQRLAGSIIALGNRSTSKTIEQLYNLYYCLLDLKYPGPEGFVVRTLHNPFGDGRNVIFAGGSDAVGVAQAADALIEKLKDADGGQGNLSVGRLMDIRLGKGVQVPTDLREFETWEASRGYGSSGYFGWNSISKRMAMYYMTGDEFQAKEALRLAFPDAKAKQEIAEIDQERIEHKDDPLAGPYHYNAHMMILFWDLIEESPVFTDEERVKVTNAFARQLIHRMRHDGGIYRTRSVPSVVGSRHGQWAAITWYCLGRYFQKSYPSPMWDQCVTGAKLHFAPLHEHAWISGESDNLFWYNTGIAPIFTYMTLTGDRKPIESGAIPDLLRGQEMLISGLPRDWALNSAALGFLHKAAYVTQDGRWVTYRERTGVDTDVFRLGQSFWPEEHLRPTLPEDLVGKWSFNHLPEPLWARRGTGFTPEESFLFGSYRSAPDASGDFILMDGFNGASRNPYHTFALLELRLAGYTLLKGYRNQVLTRADGMVEPSIAMDAALKHADVLGGTAIAVAEVPQAAFCNWRRSLVQRTGKYALVVDDLAFRTDSDNMGIQTLWEAGGAVWDKGDNALRIKPRTTSPLPAGWIGVKALASPYETNPAGANDTVRLDSIAILLLRAKEVGDWLEMTFDLPEMTSGEVFADLVNYVDRGVVSISLDGQVVAAEYSHYAPSALSQRVSLGRQELTAGGHSLRVEVIGRHEGGDRCYIGLGGLSIRPDGAAPGDITPEFAILPSELMDARTGGYTTLEWLGGVKEGERRIIFSLIGMQPRGGELAIACAQIADNAAALALPQPALAVVGEHEGIGADLAILAQDHLHALKLTAAGLETPLLRANEPVDVDWDFATGELNIVARETSELRLALASAPGIALNGSRLALRIGQDGLAILDLTPGRHVLTAAKPRPELLTALTEALKSQLAAAQDTRAQQLAEAGAQPKPEAPPLTTAFTASVPGSVADMIAIPSDDGLLVCAAEGKTIHIIAQDGAELRSLEADANIRVLHWWPEFKLLLAGCVDEQVIAFDEAGNRKWVFTSIMDPAVFEAAKQYWFKSARGHEGIHALHTGELQEGKSWLFIGSACTLEILDGEGKLVKRMPIFWGPGHKFAIIDGPDDTRNLLIARMPTDSERLAIVNSKTMTRTGSGFNSVPPGHTYVGGWACMSRDHIFYEDINGDGNKELVSEINGTWNRITVWDGTGNALHSATFGPGNPIRYRNMRDLDLADLNGDGKLELITATSSGLVVALDCQCEKLWAKRLSSPPTVLEAIKPQGAERPVILVGCQDGTVVVFNGEGEIVSLDKIAGSPTRILEIEQPELGPVAVLGTSKGEVKGFVP